MNYKLIVDSCLDFNDELLTERDDISRIPFKININNEEIIDKDLETNTLLKKMKLSVGKISTSCPSPYDFYETLKKGASNVIITISSKLSGSYQSALIAKQMFEEENEGEVVHVVDSKSASAGESLIALKVKELISQGINSGELMQKVTQYVEDLKTIFFPVSVENLERNGRIKGIKARVSRVLHIVPILGSNQNGELVLKTMAMGQNQAKNKVVELITNLVGKTDDKVLAISHVNALEKAEKMKELINSKLKFKDIHIFRAGGLSTVYADDGGLVFAFSV